MDSIWTQYAKICRKNVHKHVLNMNLYAASTSVNQGEIICDYLSIIWNYLFFSKIIWIICWLFVEKCSVFWSRLLEIIWNCGLFALWDYFGLLQIICGLFVLDYLWIIWNMESLRLFVFGLFVDYLKYGLFEIIGFGLFVDYWKHGLFEIICHCVIWHYLF